MIRFACPGCSATFTVTDEKAGKTGKCPKCQTQFTIPTPPPEEPAPPPIQTEEAPPPMQTVEAPPPIPPAVEPPPPPEPLAAPPGPNDPVEIMPCPKCTSRLSVLPSDVGLDVECPNCQTVYRARRADAPAPPEVDAPKSSALVKYGSGAKKNADDDDDDERPPRRKKKRSRRDDDDDDDDDYDDRPSRRRRSRGRGRSRRNYEPHRGMLVLIFGILGFFVNVIFGIVAWVLGANDLKAMDAGRMDPEGRSHTQIGMYLGMASVALHVVGFLLFCIIYCGIFGCFAGGAAGGAGAGAGGR